MEVKCRKCGSAVPSDIAFCPECGAVMAERAEDQDDDGAPTQFASTLMPGHEQMEANRAPSRPAAKTSAKETPKPPAAKPPAAAPPRAAAVTSQAKVRSRSSVYIVLGLVAVVLLGGLLIYLLSVILSR